MQRSEVQTPAMPEVQTPITKKKIVLRILSQHKYLNLENFIKSPKTLLQYSIFVFQIGENLYHEE
jgi:hypothetical protein